MAENKQEAAHHPCISTSFEQQAAFKDSLKLSNISKRKWHSYTQQQETTT
jgi:hypothetical protein